jgi:hypothetical protein
MKRLIAGLFITFVVLASTAAFEVAPAGACSCGSISDADAFSGSDAVFVGRVVDYEASDVAIWTFAVSQVYKGDVEARQPILSAVSGASCGLEIPRRGEFLVFAYLHTNLLNPDPTRSGLHAQLCGGTRATSDGALDPAIAGADTSVPTSGPPASAGPVGTDDVVDGSGGAPVVPIVGAAVVAVVIGLGFARRARSRAVERAH